MRELAVAPFRWRPERIFDQLREREAERWEGGKVEGQHGGSCGDIGLCDVSDLQLLLP